MGFPFGASFFLPSKGFAEDLLVMKNMGLNVARLEWPRNGTWEAMEPSPGNYDFSVLDSAMQAAEKSGVQLAVQVGIFPPRWLRDELGGEGVVNSRGLRPEPAELYSICHDNPEILARAETFIENIVTRYRDSSGLFGWISGNEPHIVYGDLTCYCTHTKNRFREWLKCKYGEIEALNDAWADYSNWSSFGEVEPPTIKLRPWGSHTAWQDWRNFIDENHARLVGWIGQTIKRYDPVHPTKVNVILSLVNTTESAADPWRMAPISDIFGTSIFVYTFEGNYPHLIAQNMDLVRSCAKACDRDAWVDEIQAGWNYCTHELGKGISPQRVALWAWQTVARGMKGLTYWMWRPRQAEWEGGEYGIVGRDGSVLPRTVAASKVADFVATNSALLESVKLNPKVAIMHSTQIMHMMYGEGMDQRAMPHVGLTSDKVKAYYTDSVNGAYKMLWDLKIPCDFVNPATIEAKGLSEYQALMLPYPYLLNESTAKAIEDFVEAGGFVISEFPSVMKDEYGHVYEQAPGAGLSSLFGCKEADIMETKEDEPICGRIGDLDFEFPALSIRQQLEVDEKAEIIARFATDGTPAVVANRRGQGGTLLIGTAFFKGYIHSNSSEALRLLSFWLKQYACVKPPFELVGLPRALGDNVEVTLLESENAKVAFVINHNDVSVRFGMRYAEDTRVECKNLVSGERVELTDTRHCDEAGRQFQLEPLGALVLEVAEV